MCFPTFLVLGHKLFVSHIRLESDEKYMWNVKCRVSENIKDYIKPSQVCKINDPDWLLQKTKRGENRLLYEKGHSSGSFVFYGLLNPNVSPI